MQFPLRSSLHFWLALLFATGFGCADKQESVRSDRGNDTIYTTFYPTTYFAGRISGGLVPVVLPIPEGEDPIFWQPPRDVLAAYQSAGLIVTNGAAFEKWVETASLPPTRTVDSAAPLDGELVRYENATLHKHGPKGEHSHEGIDGHTWLDPLNAIAQAGQIHLAMAKRWPQHAASFKANHDRLAAELQALHERLQKISPPPLLASHPAYNYLARRYGWDIDNLDLDPEVAPSPEQLADIRERLAERPAQTILWERAPQPGIAETLRAQFGLQSVEFSPCEAPPARGEDYLTVMEANVDRLAKLGNP